MGYLVIDTVFSRCSGRRITSHKEKKEEEGRREVERHFHYNIPVDISLSSVYNP
jgi:hypothetical protein